MQKHEWSQEQSNDRILYPSRYTGPLLFWGCLMSILPPESSLTPLATYSFHAGGGGRTPRILSPLNELLPTTYLRISPLVQMVPSKSWRKCSTPSPCCGGVSSVTQVQAAGDACTPYSSTLYLQQYRESFYFTFKKRAQLMLFLQKTLLYLRR